jgi:phage/plasmid primase-like uncharacterized protein
MRLLASVRACRYCCAGAGLRLGYNAAARELERALAIAARARRRRRRRRAAARAAAAAAAARRGARGGQQRPAGRAAAAYSLPRSALHYYIHAV